MDDNSTSVTSKEDVQDISLKNWLKNKKNHCITYIYCINKCWQCPFDD